MNVLINCPCCHTNINEIGTVILDNIKFPLYKDCIFCLCEMNSLNNNNKLVSCPKCGNLFHNNCFDEYLKHNKSIETPIINNTNVYDTNRFIYNPNLLPIRSVSEVNNLYIGSRFISPRPQYIFYPTNQIFIS